MQQLFGMKMKKLVFVGHVSSHKGVFPNVSIVKDSQGHLFLFKQATKDVVWKEIAAHTLARLAGITVLEFVLPASVGFKKGLATPFMKDVMLLSDYRKKLTQRQLMTLRRIMLFDILIANRDRHTANIFVQNNTLVAFDHEKAFSGFEKGEFIPAGKCMKLNTMQLLKGFISTIEKAKGKNTLRVLLEGGFSHKEISRIKKLFSAKKVLIALQCASLRGQLLSQYLAARNRNIWQKLF